MSTKPTAYSGTPLAKKLGIREGSRVFIKNAPDNYTELLHSVPPGVVFGKKVSKDTDIVHVFSDRKSGLKTDLTALRKCIRSDAAVWVSRPVFRTKQAAKIPPDITEDSIRELALPLGFVDIKVCAVNEIWSGLKLVIRKELR